MSSSVAKFAVAMVVAAPVTITLAAAAGNISGTCPVADSRPLDSTASDSCLSCHTSAATHAKNHPTQVDYGSIARVRTGGGEELRSPAEVVKRGVFLPNGKLECATCHDPRSPWKYHLALPPGAKLTPAVDLKNPATFEDGPARDKLIAALKVPTGERAAVSAKPLCLACHALD